MWPELWHLFSHLIKKETDLSDTHLLFQSMKYKEAKDFIKRTSARTDSYSEVLAALQRKYYHPRANFLLHYKAFLQPKLGEYNLCSMEDLVPHFVQLQKRM